MSSGTSGASQMSEAEFSLVATLRDRQHHLSSLGYSHARRMLQLSDRFVEDLTNSAGRFLYVSGEAIQDLGPEHRNQIEVSISVISDDAHIGGTILVGPDSPPEIASKIFRRPLDPTVTYDMCELVTPGDAR